MLCVDRILLRKPIIIHYIITSLESGGAEFSIPVVAEVVKQLGHELKVFALEPRDRMAEPILVQAGIPYTVMSDRKASKLGSLFRYASEVRASRPDLIWTSLSHATHVGQIVGALFNIPVVSWKHSAGSKHLTRWLQRSSILWIADSHEVASYLHESMGVERERIATWPLFNPKFSSVPLSRWNGTNLLQIGSSGRLHPQKNYDLLVHSVARMRTLDPETFSRFEVSIAGDGPLREELRGLIVALHLEDKVKLLGWLSDVPGYLRKLHLYVQPSAYEGMCIAAHEAMAAGLPVIATPVGEMRRSVQTGITGIQIEGDIIDGIVCGVRRLANHPDELEAYGKNAQHYVQRTMGTGAFARAGARVVRRIEAAMSGAYPTHSVGHPSPSSVQDARHDSLSNEGPNPKLRVHTELDLSHLR